MFHALWRRTAYWDGVLGLRCGGLHIWSQSGSGFALELDCEQKRQRWEIISFRLGGLRLACLHHMWGGNGGERGESPTRAVLYECACVLFWKRSHRRRLSTDGTQISPTVRAQLACTRVTYRNKTVRIRARALWCDCANFSNWIFKNNGKRRTHFFVALSPQISNGILNIYGRPICLNRALKSWL